MDLKDIQNLIKFVAKSGVKEVELKYENVEITIKGGSSEFTEIIQPQMPVIQQPVVAAAAVAAPVAEAPAAQTPAPKAEESTNYIEVKSPMIGTFYRKSTPESDPFIQVGDKVENSSVVCIIEAMKLFNEIEAEVSGTIVKVLVEDQTPVEYGQPLFLVDPS